MKKFNSNMWWKLFRAIPVGFPNETLSTQIMNILKYYSIPFRLDQNGAISSVPTDNKILLSQSLASLQHIMYYPSDMHFERQDQEHIFVGHTYMGASTKTALYIILNFLREHKDINFYFSRAKDYSYLEYKHCTTRIMFGLEGDKKFSTANKDLFNLSKTVSANGGHGFLPILEGLDSIAQKTFLLSSGFFNDSTGKDFVVMKDLYQTELFMADIIKEVNKW